MQTRRDQVQAQSFVVGRLTRALTTADPDAPESPTRRTVVGTLSGILVAGLVMAGFAGYGLLKPGGSRTWAEPGAVLVVEKETGNRYILDGDRKLRPVLNLASARLLLGEKMKVERVSAKSLADVGHGTPLGIVGAPDTLPAPGAADGSAWTVCATAAPGVTLEIGPAGAAPAVGAEQALVAVAGDGTRFLVWNGRRHRLIEKWMPKVLGFDEATHVPVAAAWLRALPSGPDIGRIAVDGQGSAGPPIGGKAGSLGQVYRVGAPDDPGTRYYLLTRDGLTRVTPFALKLLTGDPGRGAEPVPLTLSELAATRTSDAPVLSRDLPQAGLVPVAVGADQRPCLRYRIRADRIDLLVRALPGTLRPPGGGPAVARPETVASAISVAPGGGAFAAPAWPNQALGAPGYLITDAGVRYPMSTPAVAARLGYPAVSAVGVPPPLLELLPTGPLLDTQTFQG